MHDFRSGLLIVAIILSILRYSANGGGQVRQNELERILTKCAESSMRVSLNAGYELTLPEEQSREHTCLP